MLLASPRRASRNHRQNVSFPLRRYFHGRTDGALNRTGLPADAYWFQQFGFKTGGVSEEKARDYGFGVPMWSPYYRAKAARPAGPGA